mmetsp:Transcript_1489/g.2258  ORF Transcript_1489/g.2258 Transcript_1489/m.2258 type:complete len:601 (-) Transcript_1489:820-2622(-)
MIPLIGLANALIGWKATQLPTAAAARKKRNASRKGVVVLVESRYKVVLSAAKNLGWRITTDATELDWDVCWSDQAPTLERTMGMKRYQRVNHFPAAAEITSKAGLARNLNRMRKLFETEYNFYPYSWILPFEFSDFRKELGLSSKRFYIVKPSGLSQGRGIYLVSNEAQMKHFAIDEVFVAQEYIHKPLLIEGKKFDLRLYVLVTQCSPKLRIFVHREGLVRFATDNWEAPSRDNAKNIFMHLTNYAVNKRNSAFEYNTSGLEGAATGSKRSLSWLLDWVASRGYDPTRMMDAINDVVIKTFCAVHPCWSHHYLTTFSRHHHANHGTCCFAMFGFDILFTETYKPILLEVNGSPDLSIDTTLDREVKERAITQLFALLRVSPAARRRIKRQDSNMLIERVRMNTARKQHEAHQNSSSKPPPFDARPHLSSPTPTRPPSRPSIPPSMSRPSSRSASVPPSRSPTPPPPLPTPLLPPLPPYADSASDPLAFDFEEKQRKWEEKHMGLWSRIYPTVSSGKYDKFLREQQPTLQGPSIMSTTTTTANSNKHSVPNISSSRRNSTSPSPSPPAISRLPSSSSLGLLVPPALPPATTTNNSRPVTP